jgi:spore coat protein CotF
MENYLLVLKSVMEVYTHGTLESSNELVRETIHNNLEDTLTSQKDTYNLMTKYGWYQINNVDTSVINESLQRIN